MGSRNNKPKVDKGVVAKKDAGNPAQGMTSQLPDQLSPGQLEDEVIPNQLQLTYDDMVLGNYPSLHLFDQPYQHHFRKNGKMEEPISQDSTEFQHIQKLLNLSKEVKINKITSTYSKGTFKKFEEREGPISLGFHGTCKKNVGPIVETGFLPSLGVYLSEIAQNAVEFSFRYSFPEDCVLLVCLIKPLQGCGQEWKERYLYAHSYGYSPKGPSVLIERGVGEYRELYVKDTDCVYPIYVVSFSRLQRDEISEWRYFWSCGGSSFMNYCHKNYTKSELFDYCYKHKQLLNVCIGMPIDLEHGKYSKRTSCRDGMCCCHTFDWKQTICGMKESINEDGEKIIYIDDDGKPVPLMFWSIMFGWSDMYWINRVISIEIPFLFDIPIYLTKIASSFDPSGKKDFELMYRNKTSSNNEAIMPSYDMTLESKMNFQGEDGHSIPFNIFDDYIHHTNIDIHESVQLVMEGVWDEKTFESARFMVDERLDVLECELSRNEAGAIMYYSYHSSKPLYSQLNQHLADRNVENHLKPFLYYFFSGLQKLPDYKGTVYRGVKDVLFSKHPNEIYKVGKGVVWVTVTSTSQNPEVPQSFLKKGDGTLCRIEVIEGKDISQLSFYKKEKEVLLLPNSYFEVSEFLKEDLVQLILPKSNIDVIIMKQKPTPTAIKQWLSSFY
eukprot:TRINITY_DN18751_c0_g1_i1.p1 TRINITY_DN18751_c0_g1~~TRINITY_DN18751_c0_g1_i1.p1  ORF type:complete len:666 (+),score=140.14 TRINITY_DN18751_c0_g1_i1:23-2020(+)